MMLKFSILWVLLPYLGKFHKWEYIMTATCKGTMKIWADYKFAFFEVYRSVDWRDYAEEIEYNGFEHLYKKFTIDKDTKISLYCDNLKHMEFAAVTSQYRYPKIDKLAFFYWNKIENANIEPVNELMKKQTDMNEFELNWWSSLMPVDWFLPGLESLLSTVTVKIIIWGFTLCQNALKVIIESSYNVNTLGFILWAVDEIDNDFIIDDTIIFKIKWLNLLHTLHRSYPKSLTPRKLNALLKALSPTLLKKSLTDVIWADQQFGHSNVMSVFDHHGFDVLIHS